MGAKESKQISNTTNQMLNKNITNILNKTANTTSNNFVAGQSVKLVAKNGSTFRCEGNFTMKNLSGPIDVKLVNSISNETSTELKALLKNAAANVVKQNEKTFTEMGGLIGTMMSSEQETNLTNIIENVIENNVTNETFNDAVNGFSFGQTNEIVLDDGSTFISGSDCELNNEMMGISFQAENIIGNVVKTVAESESFNEAINEAKQTQELEAKGLSDLVDSLGDALSGIIGAATGPFIAFVIGGIICFIILVYFLMSGGDSSQLKSILNDPSATAAQKSAAASKMGNLGFVARLGKAKFIVIGILVLLFLTMVGLAISNGIAYFKDKDKAITDEYPECKEEVDAFLPVQRALDELNEKLKNEVTTAGREAIQGEINDILFENEDVIKNSQNCLSEKYDIGEPVVEGYSNRDSDSRGYTHMSFHGGYNTLRGYESPKAQFRSWW
jgi:hypothetical protein